jgi:IS30 family transposase
LHRNSRKDGGYRPFTAAEMARGRRSRSRRNWRFDDQDWAVVRSRLELHWSPGQIAGRLRRDKVLLDLTTSTDPDVARRAFERGSR